ncbi:hypothetical protein ACZ87_03337, partial [Candidatus Erwinia dacicola]
MGYDSTSGERQKSAREPARSRADVVSGVVDSYVQNGCASCIQRSTIDFYLSSRRHTKAA